MSNFVAKSEKYCCQVIRIFHNCKEEFKYLTRSFMSGDAKIDIAVSCNKQYGFCTTNMADSAVYNGHVRIQKQFPSHILNLYSCAIQAQSRVFSYNSVPSDLQNGCRHIMDDKSWTHHHTT